jgi:hypothetical protein
MAKTGKKSGKRDKPDKKHNGSKRSQRPAARTPIRDLLGVAPAALAVAAGGLIVAGLTSLWRVRRP